MGEGGPCPEVTQQVCRAGAPGTLSPAVTTGCQASRACVPLGRLGHFFSTDPRATVCPGPVGQLFIVYLLCARPDELTVW